MIENMMIIFMGPAEELPLNFGCVAQFWALAYVRLNRIINSWVTVLNRWFISTINFSLNQNM